jgi:hypothetical protein
MRLYYRVMLLSELDAAGHTDALETPLLLSSDSIVADVELDQGLHILWIAAKNSSSTSGQMGINGAKTTAIAHLPG